MAKAFPNTGVTIIDSSSDLPAASATLEGVMMFQKDSNELKICDGSAWKSVVDTDTPGGLVKITQGTFSASSAVDLTNVFSSTYLNYRLIINNVSWSTTNDVYFRMLSGSTPATANYYWAFRGLGSSGTNADNSGINQAQGYLGVSQGNGEGVFDIIRPNVATATKILCNGSSTYSGEYWARFGVSAHDISTAYDGIRLMPTSGTMSGSYKLYAYLD